MSQVNSKYFQFALKEQQEKAFEKLCAFINEDLKQIFLLKGYAGTGKTVLMSGLIKWLEESEIKYQLLATTGRASKVLFNKTNSHTRTIHSQIFSFKDLNVDLEKYSNQSNEKASDNKGQISLMFELKPIKNEYRTVYIVDEASMISDENIPNESFAQFGSGNLLEDLLKYDPLGKFIFVGDPCQLPPVGQFNSPALSSLHLESKYGIKSDEFELTDIIRQEDQNGIVSLSFQLRHLILNPEEKKFASLPAKGNSNINFYKTQTDLVEEYIRHLKAHGLTRSSLICQTNQQCSDLNAIIRSALYPESAVLHVGDLLMVTQNNIAANLVNGDQVTIAEIGERQSRCNLVFIRVKVKELFSEKTHDLFLIEDILKSGATNLTNAQQKELFLDFFKRMQAEGIKQKSTEFEEKMLSDKYLNAIRSVYGYVLTCHKTQGGEWEEIFLFLDNKIHGIPKPGIYQWWYTAVTRARKTLHLVDDWFVS